MKTGLFLPAGLRLGCDQVVIPNHLVGGRQVESGDMCLSLAFGEYPVAPQEHQEQNDPTVNDRLLYDVRQPTVDDPDVSTSDCTFCSSTTIPPPS